MSFYSRSKVAVLAGVLACGAFTTIAEANFAYYYDPATGNVSFDTAGATSGEIWGYGLRINPYRLDEIPENLRFRSENFVQLFSSTFTTADTLAVEQASTSETISGYYTVGDILPTGLDEMSWISLFASVNTAFFSSDSPLGSHIYFDRAHNTSVTPPAQFIYGQPDRPFDNRWDLVDPDELDWASSARLVYNPLTGEIQIDTTGPDGGHISYWAIQSEGAFLADNFTPWLDVPFTTANSDVIGFAADAIEPGVYSAGAILPANLSLREVRTIFDSARFMGRAGFGGASFDIETDGVNFTFAFAVPEPQALWILSFGSIGLSAVNRRRLQL